MEGMTVTSPSTQRESSRRAGAGERAFHRAFVTAAVVVELAWLSGAGYLLAHIA